MSPPRRSPPPVRWGPLRLLLALGLSLVAAALALELLYLVAANAFLASSWGRAVLNSRPDRFEVSYRDAFTPWPGRVQATALELAVHGRRVAWEASAARAQGRIALLPLLGRRLRVTGLTGDDVRFVADRRAKPLRPPPARRWRFFVAGDLGKVSAVRVDAVGFAGVAEIAGAFGLRAGETVRVPELRARWRGEIAIAGAPVASGFGGELALAAAPWATGGGWRGFVEAAVGDLQLAGRLDDASALLEAAPRPDWLRLDGVRGPFRAEIGLDAGRLTHGSRVSLRIPRLWVGLLGYTAVGSAVVDAAVPAAAEGWEATAALVDAQILAGEPGRVHATAERIELVATGRDARLGALPRGLRLRARVPEAQVVDVTAYNRFLPAGTPGALVGGTMTTAAELDLDVGRRRGHGSVTLRGSDLAVVYEGLDLRADADLTARLTDIDLERATLRLDATEVVVDDGRFVGAGGEARSWWARCRVEQGRLTPAGPRRLRVVAGCQLRDSRPLVALLVERTRLPRLALPLLTTEDVAAAGELLVGDRLLALESFSVQGEGLDLEGRLRFRAGRRKGVVLGRYGPFTFGLAVDGDETDVRLVEPRAWFDEQLAR